MVKTRSERNRTQTRSRSVARVAAHKARSNTKCHCLPSADGRKGSALRFLPLPFIPPATFIPRRYTKKQLSGYPLSCSHLFINYRVLTALAIPLAGRRHENCRIGNQDCAIAAFWQTLAHRRYLTSRSAKLACESYVPLRCARSANVSDGICIGTVVLATTPVFIASPIYS